MDVDLQACLAGDARAWTAFVDRWSGLIVTAVRRTARGQVDVEDTVQDVFVRLVRDDFRLLRTYDPARAGLSTWLTLVARSVTIDQMRRRRLPSVPLEEHHAPAAAAEELRAAPAPPLHLLTARQRLVLRMLFDESMGVAEAAAMLGVDEQTIRSTKHKALARLREHMPKDHREPSERAKAGDADASGLV